MFYGPGAGKYPTASAVSADVIDAVVHADKRRDIGWDDAGEEAVADMSAFTSKYYVRIEGESARSAATQSFKDIEFIDDSHATAFITAEMSEAEFERKLAALSERSEVLSRMRVLY